MTCFTIILVCDDNMIFLLLIALLAQCQSCMISICWLHPCMLVCLVYAVTCLFVCVTSHALGQGIVHPCMLVCLVYAFTCLFVCVISHALGQGIVQVCTRPYTRNLKPLLGALLASSCVVRTSIQWIYWHNPNLHLLRISPYISLRLFVCLFLLACFLILHVLFICALFAFLLCLFA